SCMYGAVCSISRSVGVLNTPQSRGSFVTANRPTSGSGLSVPTPIFAYIFSVKLLPSWQRSHCALSKNTFMPRTCDAFIAPRFPALYRSYGALPESTVRSKHAIACATRSIVISSLPKAFANSGLYPTIVFSRPTTASCVLPISIGFAIGPFACSSSDPARPSQNCAREYTRLITVGALRPPFCPRIPVETGDPSVKPCSGAWHEAQLTVSSAERRLSKYKYRPSPTFAAEYGLLLGHWIGGSPSGAFGASCANAAAVQTRITKLERI